MVSVVFVCFVISACGKKGPPLPPLVKIPAPPADFTAERRGAHVDLRFTVPNANTDGTRPANVERVDVYAFTGPATVANDQLDKIATKVGSVAVKAPRDPDLTVEPEDTGEETEPLGGEGLDQGAVAHVGEPLTTASLLPTAASTGRKKPPPDAALRPLLGPPPLPATRTYVAVGVSKRGRRGPPSKRIDVPLVPPPSPPSVVKIKYSEKEITVTWTPPGTTASARDGEPPAGPGVLPSRRIGPGVPSTVGYNVYEAARDGETRLTKSPVAEPTYNDNRIAWGAERCYVVRTVETLGTLSIESDAPPPACATLVNTFPPAAPKELHAVAGEKSINLIWEPNPEKDLAGYIVLRGLAPDALAAVTPKPIEEARYTDVVPPGVRYVYAVQAMDKAGNVGPMSNRVEEAAR